MAKKKTGKKKTDLTAEVAGGNAFSVRSPWHNSEVVRSLQPARLASLLMAAKDGDAPDDYLALAEEIEERDLYYRSLLGTRKLAIVGLDPIIEPASEEQRDQDIAAAVRRDILTESFPNLVANALDALGKGFSVHEIMWDTSALPWRPRSIEYRDPRWFEYDRETGRRLRLLGGDGGWQELPANKFIIHEPLMKSGLPIRGGLAMAALYLHLIKFSDVASWAAFMEVFGHPLRIGKFPKNANKKDYDVLKRAVRNLGRDIGVVIPDSMMIEIVDGVKPGSSTEHFERLVNWVDKQMAIGVLGQQASTEGTPGKMGAEDAREDVRLDIKEADAQQLEVTLNRDLVMPYVRFNWGEMDAWPRLRLPVPRPEDTTALVDNVVKLMPFGFRAKRSEMYAKVGLTEPEEGDEVLEMAAMPAGLPGQSNAALAALLAATNASIPQAAGELADLAGGEEWEPLLAPVHRAVEQLAREAGSYEELRRRLPELLGGLDTTELNRRLAAAQLKARALGDRDFRSEE